MTIFNVKDHDFSLCSIKSAEPYTSWAKQCHREFLGENGLFRLLLAVDGLWMHRGMEVVMGQHPEPPKTSIPNGVLKQDPELEGSSRGERAAG